MSLERKIRALRAKAASTTFPAERDSCNAKADALEAKLKAEQPSSFTAAALRAIASQETTR